MYLGNKPTVVSLKGHFELEVSNGKKGKESSFQNSPRIVSTFRNNKTKQNNKKK